MHSSTIPAEVPYVNTAFHAYHIREYLSKSDIAVVGLEPLDKDWREMNYAAFAPTAKMRFALLMDTGAPQSAAGEEWLSRFIAHYHLENATTTIPFTAKLSGIGEGSATVHAKKIVPTGMYDINNELFVGRWEAQQLEGIGKLVPPLCGFESMCNRKMIISMQNPMKPILNCIAGNKRTDFELIRHHGHILLPIDWGGSPLPSKDIHLKDPLGLNVWFGSEHDMKQTEVDMSQPQPPQSFEIVFDACPYPHSTDNKQRETPPQTYSLHYNQPPYPNPALSVFSINNINSNNTQESSSRSGPDDPLPETVMTSSTACPAVETSFTSTLEHPPGLPATSQTTSSHETTTTAFHNTHETKGHAAVHATDTVNSARTVMHQPHAAAHATHTVAHGKSSVEKQLTSRHYSLSKEKRSASHVKFSQNLPDIDNENQESLCKITNMTGATYALVKQLRLSTRQQDRLAKSATYQRKYRPLPPLSPVPPLNNISAGQWDFWEWWAGTANMSKIARIDCHMVCGPPITRENGWELSLSHHQLALMHLLDTHKPLILFAGPTCAPWSQANTTMEPELKSIIRQLEEAVFSFYASACMKQVKEGRDYVYEQPRNSALLKTSTAIDLEHRTKSVR